MSDMTVDSAREDAKNPPLHLIGGAAHRRFWKAEGFLEGHASRDPEVEELKAEIERLRSLPIMDGSRCYHGDESVVVCELKNALSAEREASRRLVEALRATNMMLTTAGYGLKDCPCGTNDHCQLHDQAAKNAELLKFYATPQASWSWPLQGGHSPEGKDVA